MYEILISHDAEKYYRRQDKKTQLRIDKGIEAISRNPFSGPRISALHGELGGRFRYAVGPLRIIYRVNMKNRSVEILYIGRRGNAYKRIGFA